MDNSLSIDVVVPSLNGRELLEQCLEHLRGQTVPHRVIVVDNGSSDGAPEMVKAGHPEATLIELPHNFGFGAAVNRGAQAGEGEVIVVINNDVFCEGDFLAELVKPLDCERRIGMTAGLLLEPENGLIDSLGIELDSTLAAYNRLSLQQAERALEPAEAPVLGPNGGAAAYLRIAFERVGGFDEKLFAYHEDVDLDLRLWLKGWKPELAPRARALHIGGATAGLGSAWQLELSSFGRWFLMRRYGVLGWSARGTYAFVLEATAVLAKSLLRRKGAILRSSAAGWRAAKDSRCSLPDDVVNRKIGLVERLRRSRRSLRSFRDGLDHR